MEHLPLWLVHALAYVGLSCLLGSGVFVAYTVSLPDSQPEVRDA